MMQQTEEFEINAETLRRLVPARKPNDTIEHLNSVSFSYDGEKLICSTDEDSIYLIDMVKGTKEKCINSKKYGCSHVKFTNDAMCALHGSTKVDNTIRYLSLSDNKYIRYFTGHQGLVTGMSVSNDNMFLSTAEDSTIRLWDLKTHNCVGLMNLATPPIASFDPEGLLFATGLDNEVVKLYDLRSYDKGPFSSFGPFRHDDSIEWTSMKFSPCGKYILVATNSDILYLIDAFTGKMKHILRNHYNDRGIPFSPSFTPESTYIMVGSTDGFVYFYDIETGEVSASVQAPEGKTCHITEFSPAHFSAATASDSLTLWCRNDNPPLVVENPLDRMRDQERERERARPLW